MSDAAVAEVVPQLRKQRRQVNSGPHVRSMDVYFATAKVVFLINPNPKWGLSVQMLVGAQRQEVRKLGAMEHFTVDPLS